MHCEPYAHNDTLSPREREVVRLVVLGMRRAQVAAALSISLKTVNNHLTNVFQKLGVHRRGELDGYAIEFGIV